MSLYPPGLLCLRAPLVLLPLAAWVYLQFVGMWLYSPIWWAFHSATWGCKTGKITTSSPDPQFSEWELFKVKVPADLRSSSPGSGNGISLRQSHVLCDHSTGTQKIDLNVNLRSSWHAAWWTKNVSKQSQKTLVNFPWAPNRFNGSGFVSVRLGSDSKWLSGQRIPTYCKGMKYVQ